MTAAAITFLDRRAEPVLGFCEAFVRCLVLVGSIGFLTQQIIQALLTLIQFAAEGCEDFFFFIKLGLHTGQQLTCIIEVRLIGRQGGDV